MTRQSAFVPWLLVSVVVASASTSVRAQRTPNDRSVAGSTDAVDAEFSFQRAAVDYVSNRPSEAIIELGSIPVEPAGAYIRGLSFLAAGESERAVADLGRVLNTPVAPPEARLDLAAAHLMAGATETAATVLEPYLASNPDDAFALYFLGIIRYRAGQYDQALREFDRASTQAALQPSIADYRQRIAESRAYDATVEAKELFRTPEGEPTMRPYLDRLEQPPTTPEKRWHLTVLGAFEYDSNVSFSPDIVGLGDTFDLDDTRFLLASFGDFLLFQKPNWNLGLIASTLDTFHFSLGEFNAQDYMIGAYSNAAMGPFILGANYQFHETLVDNQQFSAEHRFVPSASLREGEFGHTTVYYEYDHRDVDAPALIPAHFRSGDVFGVGVTQAVYLPRDGRLYAGYRFDVADTDGSDYDRQRNMVTGRIEFPLGRRLVLDAEVRFFWDDYDNPNSLDFFARPREDQRLEIRSGIQHYLRQHLSVRLDYTYMNSDSNVSNLFGVEFFSFDRHVVSTQVIYDF